MRLVAGILAAVLTAGWAGAAAAEVTINRGPTDGPGGPAPRVVTPPKPKRITIPSTPQQSLGRLTMNRDLKAYGTQELIVTHYVALKSHEQEPVSAVKARISGILQATDVDRRPGYSEEDFTALIEAQVAKERARLLTTVLHYDLNGDDIVVRDEVERVARPEASAPFKRGQTSIQPTAEQIRQGIDAVVARVFVHDLDGDWRITPEEIDQMARERGGSMSRLNKTVLPWEFDTDGNGRITRLEVDRATAAALELIDQDGNGILTRFEVAAARNLLKYEISDRPLDRRPPAKGNCAFPPVPEGTEVAVIFSRDAGAVSDLTLGKTRSPVGLAELAVPEGDAPVWVFAAFREPTVLKIAGSAAARARVELLVAMDAHMGLTGAPEAGYLRERCFFGFLGITTGTETQQERYARVIGAPITFLTGDPVGRADLATGAVSAAPLAGDRTPEPEGAEALLAQFRRYRPSGFQTVDPDGVVSDQPVGRQAVWPEEAGLLSLVESGAMVPLNSGRSAVTQRALPGSPLAGRLEASARGRDWTRGGELIYDRQPDGSWLGRDIVELGVTRPVDMPMGLDQRIIRIYVPEGVPAPRGGSLSPVVRN